MAKNNRMTLDEMLRPLTMECSNCGGKLIGYPKNGYGADGAISYCTNCSPAWLESFAIFCMNEERIKRGLNPIA